MGSLVVGYLWIVFFEGVNDLWINLNFFIFEDFKLFLLVRGEFMFLYFILLVFIFIIDFFLFFFWFFVLWVFFGKLVYRGLLFIG